MALGSTRSRKQAWTWFLEQVLGNNNGTGYHVYRERIKDDLQGLIDDWLNYCQYLYDNDEISDSQYNMWVTNKRYPMPIQMLITVRGGTGGVSVNRGSDYFNSRRVLSEQDVKDIKNLLIMGTYYKKDIAEVFGVGVWLISNINNGNRHRKVRVPNDENMAWAAPRIYKKAKRRKSDED